jgi:hypothetical protein
VVKFLIIRQRVADGGACTRHVTRGDSTPDDAMTRSGEQLDWSELDATRVTLAARSTNRRRFQDFV